MEKFQKDGKEYVLIADLALVTGYSEERLRRIARDGKVDAFLMGRTWLINLESLKQYQEEYPNRKPHKDKNEESE